MWWRSCRMRWEKLLTVMTTWAKQPLKSCWVSKAAVFLQLQWLWLIIICRKSPPCALVTYWLVHTDYYPTGTPVNCPVFLSIFAGRKWNASFHHFHQSRSRCTFLVKRNRSNCSQLPFIALIIVNLLHKCVIIPTFPIPAETAMGVSKNTQESGYEYAMVS